MGVAQAGPQQGSVDLPPIRVFDGIDCLRLEPAGREGAGRGTHHRMGLAEALE